MIVHTFNQQVTSTAVEVEADTPPPLKLLIVFNTTANPAFLQLFNKPLSSVTVGTTTPWVSIPLAGLQCLAMAFDSGTQAPGWQIRGSGLCVAGTTTRTGSVSAPLDVVIGS